METYVCKDISGCPLPLQGVNGSPEREGVVPQATQMIQDRVVAFQLPAVLPERVPIWARTCFPIEPLGSLLSIPQG